ncbi:hypothetical protein FOH38_10610 [Lysinibacillus fusiformis]|nr:hypothetical protein FOH38_10610 [Lysinibacillus fusiformis]
MEVNILGHSPTGVNADGSKIKKGESLKFEFLKEDFKLEGEATMEVSFLKNNKELTPIGKKIKLELSSNKELFKPKLCNSV